MTGIDIEGNKIEIKIVEPVKQQQINLAHIDKIKQKLWIPVRGHKAKPTQVVEVSPTKD